MAQVVRIVIAVAAAKCCLGLRLRAGWLLAGLGRRDGGCRGGVPNRLGRRVGSRLVLFIRSARLRPSDEPRRDDDHPET